MSKYYYYLIDVINSCNTQEQLETTANWIRELFKRESKLSDLEFELNKSPMFYALSAKSAELRRLNG